ncbi:MAG: DivIVA domain-containing protein [Gemmatimonadota bacterium]
MIDLTPLEVRQKKGDFRRAMRGYDAELVDDFLDLVADRMEELVKQNMALAESVASLEQQLSTFTTKERALSDALMAAQKLQEDARSHAEKEGELVVREARMAAEKERQDASRLLAREEETLRQVRARRGQLIHSFRRMLERELAELAVIEETLELEDAASRARAQAARKPEPEGQARRAGQESAEAARAELEPTGRPRAEQDSTEPARGEREPGTPGSPGSRESEASSRSGGEVIQEDLGEADWLGSLMEEDDGR